MCAFFRVQKDAIGGLLQYGEETDCDADLLWRAPTPVTLADIKLLAKVSTEPGIRTRYLFLSFSFFASRDLNVCGVAAVR